MLWALADFSVLLRTAGAVILRISHGYEVQEKDDPFVTLADLATEQFSLSTAPGGFLVNLIPSCTPYLCYELGVMNKLIKF